MKGDFTRDTFNPRKVFSRVLTQQGRVTLDADTNEQTAILLHYVRTLARDLIGPHAAPVGAGGFELSATPGDDIGISAGRYYVDGILVENYQKHCLYSSQPYYTVPEDDPLRSNLQSKNPDKYWLYLDVWERHITYLEDDSIREKALNGPDTCTRSKVIWQVKALQVDEADGPVYDSISRCTKYLPQLTGLSDARLAARVDPGHRYEDACVTPPESKYRGVENQLYRVEIHEGSETGSATFKWSRNNGSVATAWLGRAGNDLLVSSGRGFEAGTWVELSDDDLDLQGLPGTLVKLAKVEGNTLTVDPSLTAPEWKKEMVKPKVRRWDQRESEQIELSGGAIGVKEGTEDEPHWIDIEDGVQVAFSQGNQYRTGDYWLIPARVATGEIEWPKKDGKPKALRPKGIEHHFAPLGYATWKGNKLGIEPCRCEFEPLSSCFDLGSMAVGAHLLRERSALESTAETVTAVKRTRSRTGNQ